MRFAVATVLFAAVASAAEPNTWTKALETKTGGRQQPLFVNAGGKRFVLATGLQATGGLVPRHYDTEEFDLSTLRWVNAYPASVAAGRPESGPVGDDYSKARVGQGANGPVLFYKDGDSLRLGAGGQWLETRTTYNWCAVASAGAVYVSMWGRTLRYDVATRAWSDLGAEPAGKPRVWASLCHDPVNNELVHTGGGAGSDGVSTWVYAIDKNEWRKLEFGSPKFRALHAEAIALRRRTDALLGAVANRYAITETQAESRADLSAAGATLTEAIAQFAAKVRATELTGSEKTGAEVAARRLEAAAAGVKAIAPMLGEKITPDKIAAVRAARFTVDQAVDALASEPPGRARSQTALDPVRKQIVLFGGDGLDRALSDTWVYDCASRTWSQRFPVSCPTPRAGHIFAWLPKAQRFVLAGGYGRTPLAQELWTYETTTDEWKPLQHVPLGAARDGERFSPNCPRVTARGTQVGAVADDDTLVCLTSTGTAQTVWTCKVDCSAPVVSGAPRGTSGAYALHAIDPATWESAGAPDAERTAKLYADLPVNTWTALSFPKYAPGSTNRWGTTAYDPNRKQLLLWGGGHATSHENDVAHFSLRGGTWTLGFHPDDPIEIVYATQPTPLSFHDRVHVPIHAYKAYGVDPVADRMFYFDRAYNLALREWDPAPLPGLEHRGPMHSHIEATPAGSVILSDRGLFRFDAGAGKWNRLPWKGPAFGPAWCDGHTVCYDSKRNCLWLANAQAVFRYDFATATAEKLDVKKPKALGQFFFWGEEVYLPEADLLLLMNLFPKPDGTLSNVVWDPNTGKFHWADLKFVESGKPAAFKGNPFSWSDALVYDADLKLLVLNNSSARRVWVMKFDRKSVKLEEIGD